MRRQGRALLALVALGGMFAVVGAHRAAASAATYYVSPTGSDANDGMSPSTPWQTLERVDQAYLSPGDQVLLEGGQTFAGQLWITADDAGDASTPLGIGSYGTGRATIDAGDGAGIFIDNTSGVAVHDLDIVGSGYATNTSSGLYARNDRTDSSLLPGLTFSDIDVGGFGHWGVLVSGEYARSGFQDVTITRVAAHDNAVGGIIAWSAAHAVHRNVVVESSRAWGNPGVAGLASSSGSGIVLGSVDGGVIENSVAYGNGGLNDSNQGGCGIWSYESNAVTIQGNESYGNLTGGKKDGGGFDLDQDSTNSVLQYNYSHGNAGPGLMLAQRTPTNGHSGNAIRYNVGQNDGRMNGQAGITVWGHVTNADVYSNTIYMAASPGQAMPRVVALGASGTYAPSNVAFRNNIFDASGAKTIDAPTKVAPYMTNVVFQGNDYWKKVSIRWDASNYSTLAAWRAATGEETLNGSDTGMNVNPQLVAPGNGGTVDGSGGSLAGLTAYTLKTKSPLIDAGLDLPTLFGTSVGNRDFYADTVPRGPAFDVGADEAR